MTSRKKSQLLMAVEWLFEILDPNKHKIKTTEVPLTVKEISVLRRKKQKR